MAKNIYASPIEVIAARRNSWDELMRRARHRAERCEERSRVSAIWDHEMTRWTYVIECPDGCRQGSHFRGMR